MPGPTNGLPEKLPQSNEVKGLSQGKVEVGTQDKNAQNVSMNSLKDLGKSYRDLKSLPGFTATKNRAGEIVKAVISKGTASVQSLLNVRGQQKDAQQVAKNEVEPGAKPSGESQAKGSVEAQADEKPQVKGAAAGSVKPPAEWGTSGEKKMMKFRRALLNGDAKNVKKLIKDNPEIVNGCENMYLRPLELASISENKEVINIIMNSEKLNVNIVDDNGHTMLHRAALIGDPDNILGILSDKSNNVPEDVLEGIKEHKGNFNLNPSQIAKEFKYEKLAAKLAPANPARSEPAKQTAETKSPASSEGVSKKAKTHELSPKKAETSSKEQETLSQNIEKLNQLIKDGSIDDVEEFLNKHPNRIYTLVNAVPDDPGGPLVRAAFFGKKDMVRFLISKGAHLNVPLKGGMTLQKYLEGDREMKEPLELIQNEAAAAAPPPLPPRDKEQALEKAEETPPPLPPRDKGISGRKASDLPSQLGSRAQEAGRKPPVFTPASENIQDAQKPQGAQKPQSKEGWKSKKSLDQPLRMPTKKEPKEELEAGKEIKSERSEEAEQAPAGEEASGPDLTQEADKLQKQLDSFLSAKGLAEEDKAPLKEGLQNLRKTLDGFQTDQGKDNAKAVLEVINKLSVNIDKVASAHKEGVSEQRRRTSTKAIPKLNKKFSQKLDDVKIVKEQTAASLREMSRTVLEKSEVSTPSISGGEKVYEGKLKNAVEELRDTEKTYNTNLKGYLNALKELKEQGVIDDEQFKGLAGGVEPIIESSDAILDSLNSRDLSTDLVAETLTNGRQTEIGRRHAPYLANYSTGIVPVLDELKKPQYSEAIESAMKEAGLDLNKGLGDYAIEPVQRMPRYNMLLNEIGSRSNNPQVLQRKEFQEVASKFVNTQVAIREELAPLAEDAEQIATLPPLQGHSVDESENVDPQGAPEDKQTEAPNEASTPTSSKEVEGESAEVKKTASQREPLSAGEMLNKLNQPKQDQKPPSLAEQLQEGSKNLRSTEKTPPPLPPRDKEGISETAEETSRPAKPPETEDKTTEKSPPPGSLADRLREVKLKKTGGREQTEQPKEETGMQGALKNAVNRANVPEGEGTDSVSGVDEKEWDEQIEGTTEASAEAEEAPPVPEREELDETPPPLPERPEDEKVDTQGAPKPSETTEKEVNLADEMAKRRGAIASDEDEEVEEEDDDWLENL